MSSVFASYKSRDFFKTLRSTVNFTRKVNLFSPDSEFFENEVKNTGGGIDTLALTYTMNRTIAGNTLGIFWQTFEVAATGTVDWGDGTIESFVGVANGVEMYHVYNQMGIVVMTWHFDNPLTIEEFEDDYFDPSFGISAVFGPDVSNLDEVYFVDAKFTDMPALPPSVTEITYYRNGVSTLTRIHDLPILDFLQINPNNIVTLTLENLPLLADFPDTSQITNLLNINIIDCPAMTVCNVLSNLSTIQSLNISGCSAMVSLGASSLALTNINITGLTSLISVGVAVNQLPVSEVNALLIYLDANGTLNGTATMNNQAPAAPPSGAGIAAKNNLIGKGWTVTTD